MRHAQYLHKTWKKHQDAVDWVDINLAIAKGLKFYQTRSNAIILQETLPAYCIPKVVWMETGEVIYEKVYAYRRLARLISYIHHTSDYRQCCHAGNTAQHCRLGFIPRLRFCWRPSGLKINFGRNLVYLWKSNIISYQLDV